MLTRSSLAAVLMLAACARPLEAISISDNVVTVTNQTPRDWRNVVVTVNDHFRGGAPVVAAGGRLTAPLGQFQTAFGQRYDTVRQSVVKIEVAATDITGEPVNLVWEKHKGLAP